MQKILLIHSDLVLGGELAFLLQHSGFHVVSASKGEQVLAEIRFSHPDLVVIAERLAKTDGDEFFLRIRELCQAPILILGEEQKEAAGIDPLEMGADAYLPSPLNFRELLARVRSLLRRTQAIATEFRGG